MARTRTLTNLLTDVRWQADQLGATLRHDDASLTRAINQSIQRYREWLSEQGSPLYLVPHAGTLTVGPTAPYAYGTIDMSGWSPTPLHVYSMEVTVSGRVCDVPSIPFEHRNHYQGRYGEPWAGQQNGVPAGFFRYQSTLGVVPPAGSSYAYTVWYMPQLADLVNPNDAFDGVAGWEEWLVWDVMVKIIVRDVTPEQFGMATSERDRIQAEILQRLRQDRPSVSRRQDVRGSRQRRLVR